MLKIFIEKICLKKKIKEVLRGGQIVLTSVYYANHLTDCWIPFRYITIFNSHSSFPNR